MQASCGSSAKICCAPRADGAVKANSADLVVSVSAQRRSEGAISLPGGRFLMGTDYSEAFFQDGEGPVRPVELSPFAIEKFPVTTARFLDFTSETGYITEAEQFGWSFVFYSLIPKKRYATVVRDTVEAAPWWCQVPGATFRTPEGPGSDVRQRMDHPVVHVSWNDANAFCRWAGTRLPTEAEWEYAARGGLEQKLYPWGDKLRIDGKHQCNIWQGDFPANDTGDDGFRGTCPVDAFSPNGFGIYSLAGNTWDWCSDRFATKHGELCLTDPTGPEEGAARVMKGGSFLCHKSYCNRYRVAARTSNTPDSTASNVSFRCVVADAVSPVSQLRQS